MMNLFTKDGTAKLVPRMHLSADRAALRQPGLHRITRSSTSTPASDGRVRVLETFGITVRELAERMAIKLR